MARHHNYFKCPCIQCKNFRDNKCIESNLRFKKFEVSKLTYVDLEVALFFGEKGQVIKIFPSMRFVSYHTNCGIFEGWLNNQINDLTQSQNGIKAMRCETFERFEYD